MNTRPDAPELAIEVMNRPTTEEARNDRHDAQIQRIEGNIALNDAVVDTPFIATNAMQSAVYDREEKKRGEERASILRSANKLIRRIAEIDAEIEIIDREIEELDKKIEAVQRGIDILEGGGTLELNESGEVADPNIEAAIREYERITGNRVDRSNSDDLLAILTSMDGLYHDQRNELGIRKDSLSRERDGLSDELMESYGVTVSDTRQGVIEQEQEMYNRLAEIESELAELQGNTVDVTATVTTEVAVNAFDF